MDRIKYGKLEKEDIDNIRLGAKLLKQLYDEFVRAGFTKKHAFELIKDMIPKGGRK